MFYELQYRDLGFREDEWEDITAGDKRLIRDWVLNGYSDMRVVLYDEYLDDTRIKKLRQKYQLDERPKIKVSLTQIHLY